MLELAYSAVTMPDTQCQTYRFNKLTRDKALYGAEAVLSHAVVPAASWSSLKSSTVTAEASGKSALVLWV